MPDPEPESTDALDHAVSLSDFHPNFPDPRLSADPLATLIAAEQDAAADFLDKLDMSRGRASILSDRI